MTVLNQGMCSGKVLNKEKTRTMNTNEELNNSVTGEQTVDDGVDYVAALNAMKQNSVSKSQYDKLKQENKRLLDSIVNGTELETTAETLTIDELRKKTFDSNASNLDFWKNALKLRERLIEEGKPDPFVPTGKSVSANQIDYDGAERLAAGIQSCIDYANGDSQLFTNELQRITKDVMPMRRRG